MSTFEQAPVKKGKDKPGVRTISIEKMVGDMANYTNSQLGQYRQLGYTISDEGHQYVASISEEKALEIEKGFQEVALSRLKASNNLTREDRMEGAFKSTLEDMAPVSPSDFLAEIGGEH